MLVNATSGVKLYHFAEARKESTERGQEESSSKSAASLGEFPLSPIKVNHTASPGKKRRHDFRAAGGERLYRLSYYTAPSLLKLNSCVTTKDHQGSTFIQNAGLKA